MNQFYDLPPESTFGWDFNYATWAPNTEVTICKVRWNTTYKDAVMFNNRAALNSYINTAGGDNLVISDAVYLKMGQPVDLDIPFAVANEYNYLRVYNPIQPISGDKASYFYYFISSVEYVAPDTTRFHLQLDVWQTYIYEIAFGTCFFERGHYGIAAENSFEDHGREFLNIPEGFDIGNEYTVVRNYQHSIATARGDALHPTHHDYDILVMTAASLTGELGTVDAPKLDTATGSDMENLPNGCEIYWIDAEHFGDFMTDLSTRPWVSQAILSITAIPNNVESRYGMILSDVYVPDLPSMPEGSIKEVILGGLMNPSVNLATNWRDEVVENFLPEAYRHLKKLLTFPYTVIEMTSYTGQPIILKPEAWSHDNIQIEENPHLIPGHGKIVFYPQGYNRHKDHSNQSSDLLGIVNDYGEFLDGGTAITNLPTFSIVNNNYIAFMASNKNNIAFQHQSADWSQQRALTGNMLSFDQASAGMNLTNELNRLNVNTAYQNTNLAHDTLAMQGLQSGANSLIGGVAGGKPIQGAAGMLNSAISMGIAMNQNTQSYNIATSQMNAATNANVSNAEFMRDTNKSYADYSAKGDYQNTIAAINAKVQDAKLIQPSTSGQVGGDSFNLARYHWGVDVKVKMMQGSAMRALATYWLRYGYQMNMFMTPPANLKAMSRFTYWKFREVYITSAKCPEFFKETIRGILEKGVTVWSDPNDIGNLFAANEPIEGIVL